MPEEKKIDVCPKCGSPLGDIQTTSTGKKLQRCSNGSWDSVNKTNIGCDYVKWLQIEPEVLAEKCPKCGAPLIMAVTRFGKKMKRCSKNVWNKETKKSDGCDYIEWINGSTEEIGENCPICSKPLVLFTTSTGKRMIKCSTSGWDRERKMATGCSYVQWLRPDEYKKYEKNGEENLPPETTDEEPPLPDHP